ARDAAVEFLESRLQPKPNPDTRRIKQLIGDLGSDSYSIRAKGFRELEKIGELTEPALREVLKGQPSVDLSRRIELLLQKIDHPHLTPVELQKLRALEVLEQIGTTRAKALLQKLGKGAPGVRLTQEARGSLERLVRRQQN